METILVGRFNDLAAAQWVRYEPIQRGISPEKIEITAEAAPDSGNPAGGAETEPSLGERVNRFLDRLLGKGLDTVNRELYLDSVRTGRTLVSVITEAMQMDTVISIMNSKGALEIEGHLEQEATTAGPPPLGTPPTDFGKLTVPIIEEELEIGKKVVQRGGVRIHTRTVEKPVETKVNLRQEHVHIERRAVDRPVSQADLDTLEAGAITLTEQAEEAVIGKRKRVVEEVIVSKETESRTETLKDTLRRTDVEIEGLDTSPKKRTDAAHQRKVS